MSFRRLHSAAYTSDLLEQRFVAKNVMPDAPKEMLIKLSDIYHYVSSLQEAVGTWYKMWNPFDSDFGSGTQVWLDKLNRLGPLIFSQYSS